MVLGSGKERFLDWRKARRSRSWAERGGCIKVVDEVREFSGDVNGWKEEMEWGVDASGGAVGRVECGVHVPGDEDCVTCLQR